MPKTKLSYKDLVIPEVKFAGIDANTKLAYRELGDQGKPTVLMLPSWPANSIEYIPLMNMLKTDFHCIAVDFPNWTGKSECNDPTLNIEDYADMMTSFLNNQKIDKANLIGYSFSVPVATLLKSRLPEKIQKVVLISGFTNGIDIYNRYPSLIAFYKRYAKLVPEKLASSIVKRIMFRTYKHTLYYKKYKDLPLFQEFFGMLNAIQFKRALSAIIDITDRDYTQTFVETYKEELPLLVWASKDPEFVRTAMKKLDKLIGSPDITIKGADHNHVAFEVEKSAERIRNFLASKS